MADNQPENHSGDHVATRRRMPDLLALVCGLAAMAVATTAIAGSTAWLPPIDARWLLAGAAMAIGLLLLVSSLRPADRS